jgi:hypothetical protein
LYYLQSGSIILAYGSASGGGDPIIKSITGKITKISPLLKSCLLFKSRNYEIYATLRNLTISEIDEMHTLINQTPIKIASIPRTHPGIAQLLKFTYFEKFILLSHLDSKIPLIIDADTLTTTKFQLKTLNISEYKSTKGIRNIQTNRIHPQSELYRAIKISSTDNLTIVIKSDIFWEDRHDLNLLSWPSEESLSGLLVI